MEERLQRGSAILAWMLMASILFMGCYTSALIEPAEMSKGRLYTGKVESLMLIDSTQYVFQVPAQIVNDTVVGTSYDMSVRIPAADVSKVTLKKTNPVGAVFLVLG